MYIDSEANIQFYLGINSPWENIDKQIDSKSGSYNPMLNIYSKVWQTIIKNNCAEEIRKKLEVLKIEDPSSSNQCDNDIVSTTKNALNVLISQLNEKEFTLFWNVYYNAESLRLGSIVGNLYEYAYKYVSNVKNQNTTNYQEYFFGSEKTISDMEYQLIDIEINAIGKQLLNNYNINYIGSTGQGIGVGIDNMLPQLLDNSIIGIYNPGNHVYGHWTVFLIVKNQVGDDYTIFIKDSFGASINQELQSAIEKKYGTSKNIIHHQGNEQAKDSTSCGIYALANAEIITRWLINGQDKNFQDIEFTQPPAILELRNQYNEINIKAQEAQEIASHTSQSLSDNLIKILVTQEPYMKVLQELKKSFSNIIIQQEEWMSDINNFKTFSASNTENTIFVGISFGENRSLINTHQYNITIEVSNNISEQKQNIIKNILKENNLKELVIDKDIFVAAFDSLPDIKGNNEMQEGLSTIAINSNLASIISLSHDNLDFHIAPKIMSQKELLLNLNDWKIASSSHYGALIKVENKIGNKHAVLLYALKVQDQVVITITDPLSNEDSTFKGALEKLAQSLYEQGTIVDVIYSGRQNKDYATCADMSLIMLQELVELEANMIHKKVLNDIVTFTHTSYKNCCNSMIHNGDYDNLQLEIAGDAFSFH